MKIKSVVFVICFVVQSFMGAFAAEFIVHVSGQDTNEVTEHLTIAQDADGVADFSGGDRMSESGEPQIPWKVMTLLLPPNADMETVACRMVSSEYKTLEGAWDIAPVPPMVTANQEKTEIWPSNKTIVEGRDTAIYSRDALWPTEKVRLEATGRLRSWRLAEIALPMVRFNPVSGELQELVRAEVSVDFNKKGKSSKAKSSKEKNPSRNPKTGKCRGYDRVNRLTENFDTTVMLYAATEDETKSAEPDASADEDEMVSLSSTGTNGYVIITTQAIRDTSTKLADFVTHKENMGFTVTVVDEDDLWGTETPVEGDPSATKLREWLQANYEDLDLKYVLIIGDPRPDQGYVPMKKFPNDSDFIPTDYFYAELTCDWDKDGDGIIGEWQDDATNGDEIERYFEVYVGRIPYYGVIADTDRILQKTIDYETSTDTAWRRKVLISAKPMDENSSGYEWGEQIKADYLEPKAISSDRVYKDGSGFVAANAGIIPPPEFPASTEIAQEVWSVGQYGLHVWLTHGGPEGAYDIIPSDGSVDYLTDDYPSTVFQASCQNAWPENTNNLSYTLLKKGGILTIGAVRNSGYFGGQTDFSDTATIGGMGNRYAQGISEGKSCGEALWGLKEEITVWWKNNWANFNPYGDPSVVVFPPTPDFTIMPTDAFFTRIIAGAGGSSASRSYELINNSGSALNWTASQSATWFDLSATNGTISAGSTNVVNMTLNAETETFGIDTYEALVTFTDSSNNIMEERPVVLVSDEFTTFWGRSIDDSANWSCGYPVDAEGVVAVDGDLQGNWNVASMGASVINHTAGTISPYQGGFNAYNNSNFTWNQNGGNIVTLATRSLLANSGTHNLISGTVTAGSVAAVNGGTFTQTGGAVIGIASASIYGVTGGGVLNLTGGTGASTVDPAVAFNLESGTINVGGDFVMTFGQALLSTNTAILSFSTNWTGSFVRDNYTTADWQSDLVAGAVNVGGTEVTDTNFASLFLVANSGAVGSTLTIECAPVADNQSRLVFMNDSISIMLTGSDANNDPLTYVLLDLPSHGVLSGTAPNLTYTPDLDYLGLDEFTFKVNDGDVDSSVATISIRVLDPDCSGVFLWDFDAVEELTTNSIITVPVDSNTFGSGVTVSDLTIAPGALGNDYAREVKLIDDRVELGMWGITNFLSHPTVSFTVTIDADITVSLISLAADLGFHNSYDPTASYDPDSVSPYSDLYISLGSASPSHVALGVVLLEEETLTNVVSSLSELENLTDTSVTFSWVFASDKDWLTDTRWHVIDNVELLVARIVDSDGDNLPDEWETRMGLDPVSGEGDDGADADPDGDGMTNLEEYTVDTHPLDNSSVLRLIGMENTPSGIEITWQGGELAQQEIEYAQSMINPEWMVYTNLAPPTATTNTVVVPASTNRATFFRIRVSRP